MTGLEAARTVRYRGHDLDEVRRAFAADSERALASGYVVSRSWWDTSEGSHTLVVDYVQASLDQSPPPGPPSGARSRSGPTAATGRGGLIEALLIVGLILAVIITLAVTIPSAPPTTTPSLAPGVVPIEPSVPASPGPASSPAGG